MTDAERRTTITEHARVLVVLPNWFGETLFATPFLRALKQARPQATVQALGWPQCQEVLRENPHVNRFLAYDERGAHRGLGAKWGLIQHLRAQHFDAAFVLRPSRSRAALLALAGIPVRVGFSEKGAGWLTHRVPRPVVPQHKALTYLPLLGVVGLRGSSGPYEYVVGPQERRAALERLAAAGLDGRRVVVLHPGANWPHKRWAPARFAALADRLVASHGVAVLVTGGPQDVGLGEAIRQAMRQSPVLLIGRTSLRELAACLERADLVVTNDTGILHVAAALGRPVVGLYGPTSPQFTGPFGNPRQTIVIHHPEGCPRVPCVQRPTDPPHPGMDAIPVEEVYDAASRLLTRHP